MERSIIWRRICSGKPAQKPDCGRTMVLRTRPLSLPSVSLLGRSLIRLLGQDFRDPLNQFVLFQAEFDLHVPGGCYVDLVCAVHIDGPAAGTLNDGQQGLQLFYSLSSLAGSRIDLANELARFEDRFVLCW